MSILIPKKRKTPEEAEAHLMEAASLRAAMRGEAPPARDKAEAGDGTAKKSILGLSLGSPKKPDKKLSETNVTQPPSPRTLTETGINAVFARDIFLKTMFRRNLQTLTSLSKALCVTPPVVQELIDIAREQNLIETTGKIASEQSTELRYQMTESGKSRALDALAQSEYFGALPVPLPVFMAQVQRQKIKDVAISRKDLEYGFRKMVLPESIYGKLGPAVNSGRSVLLYGPPGNGKSSLANGMRDALGDKIFVPKFLEYNGQIISVYDPVVHGLPVQLEEDESALRREVSRFDQRFHLVSRPCVIAGGELRLDMLELIYNETSKTYQAPLQLKSSGGVFIVDDLGRQVDPPQAMINRWITPMESKYDILTLASGEKFSVPFDTLVVFSTNFHPSRLFDQAALRRIQYKLLIDAPTREEMLQIYLLTAKAKKVTLSEDVLVHLFTRKYPEVDDGYAAFHAPFLIDQMQSICEFEGIKENFTPEMIDRAWEHLFVESSDFAH